MYQDLMQAVRIHSAKSADHNARKRNMHSNDETDILPYLEKIESTLPMLIARKASTQT